MLTGPGINAAMTVLLRPRKHPGTDVSIQVSPKNHIVFSRSPRKSLPDLHFLFVDLQEAEVFLEVSFSLSGRTCSVSNKKPVLSDGL